MSFLFSCFKMIICLFNIQWSDTTVDVPLGADIDVYKDIPKAILYEDNVIVEDAIPTYKKTGVNRTFLSVVNTNYVKAYKIYFEVYFDEYEMKSVVQITFNVIDDVDPIMTYIPTFEIQIGQSLPDFRKNLIYSDNYDEQELLLIDVDQSKIIKDKIGRFPITYTIWDTSMNNQSYDTYIDIVDHIAPVIDIDFPIIFQVNQAFYYDSYIEVNDNYDQMVDFVINDESVDYHRVGTYQVSVSATDSSKNESSETFYITIVDQVPPNIFLSSYPKPIEVNQELSEEILKSYILSVDDNYDQLSIDDVVITHDIDVFRVGSYKIYYQIKDFSNNEKNMILNVDVVDLIKPNIDIITPFVFEVFSEPKSLLNHIEVSDNYCAIDDIKTTINTSYNLDVVGTYDIIIEATDAYKNKTTYQGFIEVIDSIPPEIIELTDIIITDFKEKDLSIYFKAIDQYDMTELDIIVDDVLVDYHKIGSYDIFIEASDSSLNKTMIKSIVLIIDITAPNLILTSKEVYFNVKSKMIDLEDYVLELSDNYDELNEDDLIISSTIDMDVPGSYEVIYSLKDSSLNETKETLKVVISDYEKPYIYADPIYIKMYESIDYLKDLTVTDNVGVKNIYYQPSIIDSSKPGVYEVTYIVMDLSGNTSEFIRTIYINEIEKNHDITSFIPLVIITIFSISIIYVLYKKL